MKGVFNMNGFSFLINASVFGNILFWLVALIVFILVLGVIILIHEGGHFFFAKKAGILCHEFSIGMGPVVKTIKKGETNYSIRAIPVGGFVSMAGEDTNEAVLKEGQKVSLSFKDVQYNELLFGDEKKTQASNELVKVVNEISLCDKVELDVIGTVKSYDLYSVDGDAMYVVLDVDGEEEKYLVARDAFYIFTEKQKVQMAPYERCYESKTKLQRFLTVFAGPFMNFVLAFLIFLVVGLCQGVANVESNEIGKVTEGYYASKVLQEGDKILAINGNEIGSWNEISAYLDTQIGQEEIVVTFERDGQTHTESIKTVNISYRLGVSNMGYEDYDGKGLKVFLVFDDNYVAGKAGMVNGDILLAYKDKSGNWVDLESWGQLFTYLEEDENLEELEIRYCKEEDIEKPNNWVEKKSDVWTKRSIDEIAGGSSADTVVGISPTTRFSLTGGLVNAVLLFWNSITTVFVTLGALFGNSQITINELSGPVGIFAVVKQYLTTDPISFFSFVGLISANIGLVNLLPLPALDGGRIVFIGYELVTGKKVNKKVETILINIVFWMVMLLFVYITFKDIFRLF